MDNKPLLYGLIGFFIGGLLVAIAATAVLSAEGEKTATTQSQEMTMTQMVDVLKEKSGDEYDQEFIAGMIHHHQGALAMAELSAERAKHDEIKQLSLDIISAQQKEIELLQQWQKQWGYTEATHRHSM